MKKCAAWTMLSRKGAQVSQTDVFNNKVENKSALLTCFRVSPALSSSPRIANATARLYCITAPAVASVLGNHAAHTHNKYYLMKQH